MFLEAHTLHVVAFMYWQEQPLAMHQNMTQMLLRRLLHNFYVYDLLRSVESEEIAIQLIKDVRKICGEGGFNLNKFICTEKKFSNLFLNAIKGVGYKMQTLMDVYQCKGYIWWIYWDIEKDTFKFKINYTEKSMAFRRILSMISSVHDSLGVVAPYTLKGKKLPQKLCQDQVGCDETPPGKIIKEH